MTAVLRAFALCTTLGVASGMQAQTAAPKTRRIAVIVGANAAAPGRRPLRYAQNDAREVASVLRQAAGFAPGDLHVLLDPRPAEVLAALDSAARELSGAAPDSMLLFYYSGHADAHAFYPAGTELPFEEVRRRLAREPNGVRVGILDACRGGGWTGARGLSESEPFEVDLPLAFTGQGSVLIASSSGLEDAHESEQLQGGFFTHHWNAGLRGAADRDGDRAVTVGEAFEYAKERTIRDTALHTGKPQHPSFHMDIVGRQALALTRPALQAGRLEVHARRAAVQVIRLDSGLVVLEVPQRTGVLQLAVPPGRYLLRSTDTEGRVRASEVTVRADAPTVVRDGDFALVGAPELSARSIEPRPMTRSTLTAGDWELTLALGVRHGTSGSGLMLDDGSDNGVAGGVLLAYGLNDRLQLVVGAPAVVYRGGDRGGLEWLPWAGLLGWSLAFSSSEGTMLSGEPGAGLDLRQWLSERSSLDFGLSLSSEFRWTSRELDVPAELRVRQSRYAPTTWRGRLALGYTHTIGDVVTLSAGIAYGQNLLDDGDFADRAQATRPALYVGSVGRTALRPQPLVRVHLSDDVALDGHVVVGYEPEAEVVSDAYMLGATFRW